MPSLHARVAAAAAVIVAAGCVADDFPVDSAHPAGLDSAGDSETGPDTGVDTAHDTAPDTGRDTGTTLTFDERVDVVVVGAGPAGLAAAAEAFAAGLDVLVLEREEAAGGACNLSIGRMLFAGVPEQAALGIDDSPARLAEEWKTFTGGDPTDPWFEFFAENHVPMVYSWLTALGVKWGPLGGDESSGDVDRVLEVDGWGPALVAVLLDQVPADDVRYRAQADELLVDDARVVGLRWTDLEAGTSGTIGAGAVVVATGGFQYDLERVVDLLPDVPAEALRRGSFEGADGNGHDMLLAVGAATQNLEALGFYAHGTFHPDDPTGEVSSRIFGGYPVFDATGHRFHDDDDPNSFPFGRARAFVPGDEAWLVTDDHAADIPQYAPGDEVTAYSIDDLVAAGIVVREDTLESLAAAISVDADAVLEEIATWNAAVRGEQADPWRGERGATEVNLPPFLAVPVAATAAKAFGGVDVDLGGRVLDRGGAAIPGLYAAGELTGMLGGSIVGTDGFTGSLTAVILGGRVAGQQAAAEVAGSSP